MIMEDINEILLRHKVKEMDAIKESNKILFIDTDSITTMFYTRFLLNKEEEIAKCSLLADAITNINEFDLILFLEPTVDFIQDGTRSEIIEADREKYSSQIKELLDLHSLKYHCISGDYLKRFNGAKKLIEEHLGLNTRW